MKYMKYAFVLLLLLMVSLSLWGCSYPTEKNNPDLEQNIPEETGKTTISVFNLTRMSVEKIIQKIVKEFQIDNPDINIKYTQSATEFENIMKIKMASHDMPDVFSTHGWAIKRYGNFLADLSSEDWASRVKESMKPFVIDKEGKLYVLPIDEDRTGHLFNAEILEKYGIDIPATFEELINACEIIKNKSFGTITPIYIAGGESGQIGNFYDFYSSALFVSPTKNYINDLEAGTFDWSKFNILSEKLLELKQKGLINENVISAKYNDMVEAFANRNVAFICTNGPSIIYDVKIKNPDLKVGIMPIPSMVNGEAPIFISGEKTTWGVWKDSPNISEAKKFVSYFAKQQNIKQIAEANGVPSGLIFVNEDLGELTKYYNMFKNIQSFPYFDRQYLPSGMWDVMCKNGQDLVAGIITPQEYSDAMKKEFARLYTK